MPVVFVHGVADTLRVWDDVRRELGNADSLALALPGFGADLPVGFRSDKESYVQWIIEQLEKLSVPVDLVGHDWGCIFALRVASLRPDLIRAVVAGSGPVSSNYEWHPLAKIWQTPVEGEKFMQELTASSLSEMLQSLGVPVPAADSASKRVDDRMKDSILKLYRSAVHVGAEWQGGLANISCPVALFWGTSDKECPVQFAHEMASLLLSGRVAEMDSAHWVPLQRPEELANLIRTVIESF